ncbi:transcription accessory protein [Secundilactobacillus pentosiphilus]|uniref:Transcription accessory protein n=1 Tax=Secundilactobacillus pentosiphilus TaxID=1714682 RepID=A0A1Z5INJ7_9LACO|nr:Tex family protein [Secundilactobacillus pentosiphilus]GAX03276.1 transcription accessory protein [Secundilactobacillus pentosiphilus]
METETLKLIKQALPAYKSHQIDVTLDLLNDNNTVPFIARYRKEMTGNLDEVEIREIQDEANRISKLQQRKQEVLKQISEQGKLTAKLSAAINAATQMQQVEDLYLPYKQKRRTKATIAKEAGLFPLAQWVLQFNHEPVETVADKYINEKVPDRKSVLAGVHEILAEAIGERAEFRDWIRRYTQRNGVLTSQLKRNGQEQDADQVYQIYYDFQSALKKLSPYQTLAMNRGEKAGVLTVKITVDEPAIEQYLKFQLIGRRKGPAVAIVGAAYQDAYKRFIGPAIERELRRSLTETAQDHAIQVFGNNLYHLLMQAPLKNHVVMGFDPAYRTGCKLAIMDGNGKFLAKQVIYPHKPASAAKRKQAMPEFIDLLNHYQVDMIAIGNGTASRESEQFVAEAIKQTKRDVRYTIVNEAGASVYSASAVARTEFPDFNVEERSAVSIGRRLQDPLAELVKIDPKSVGVGQYQHDVPESSLDEQLDRVVETAVNQVGVDLNRASVELLARISGLTKQTAINIVAYREENGSFTSRPELKKVPRLGPKAYEQSVGFLRIVNGKNVLDNTDIHPESYPVAKRILASLNLNLNQVGTPAVASALENVAVKDLSHRLDVGSATLQDILKSLQRPGRDRRDDMPAPILRTDVLQISDLKPGMKLQGTVRNVVDFGIFVDIGVKQDGLVHISHLSKAYVSSPAAVASVGDIVTVWVLEVDEQRHRIQLTMVAPND